LKEITCRECRERFVFDEESGLNMRDFPPQAFGEGTPNAGFFKGGVCPCCPRCSSWCSVERAADGREYTFGNTTDPVIDLKKAVLE
jgi:hypothetical protein